MRIKHEIFRSLAFAAALILSMMPGLAVGAAGPVSFGTGNEVIADCRKTLDAMMPGGGYCFAPTHALQDNSPTENVLAMYDTAKRYGKY